MFNRFKIKEELMDSAPIGAEWATVDGEFYFKILEEQVFMYVEIGEWLPSSQLADDIRQSPNFFVKL